MHSLDEPPNQKHGQQPHLFNRARHVAAEQLGLEPGRLHVCAVSTAAQLTDRVGSHHGSRASLK